LVVTRCKKGEVLTDFFDFNPTGFTDLTPRPGERNLPARRHRHTEDLVIVSLAILMIAAERPAIVVDNRHL
jgi:hypothetical protein